MSLRLSGLAAGLLALAVSGATAATGKAAPIPAPARTAAAATPGDGVRARLAAPAVLRGRFEQSKQLKGFRHPLVSRGDFLLLRDRGVAWDTREPFASSTLLTRERLLTRLPDGSTRVLVDAGTSPGMAAVNALLMALVAGDLDALSTQFDAGETLLADGAWQLRLRPRDAGLARMFTTIELRGDRHVREVEITETGGDHTLIRFLELVDIPAAATPAEAARFD